MAESATFFWYDYETFGRDPARDRVAQFAGLRTDEGLNVLGEPSMFFCQPPEDYLPHPEACLITGITPQQAREQGLVEREFTAQVHAELARPGTCSVGYNSIRFDDEFTRYLLFRNFHDPYAREWTGNNSRWDLLDVMRMARLLRPDGLEWPDREGRPSFRLEDLTRTNGIEHGAHDALADARATLELARRLRAAQPRLWDYALRARDKRWVLDQLDLRKQLPVLHVSGRFAAERGAAALVLPLAPHPTNRNSIIVCNLGADPGPLLGLDAATLRRLLYARSAELPPGMERIPLKEIHANKSPMLAPESMLTAEVAARCGIDHAACRVNRERLLGAADLPARLAAVYAPAATPAIQRDPEADLYGGSFLGDADRRLAERVRAADAATLAGATFPFADPRLPELLFRYRARNFPDSLNPGERARWREHCATRLHGESVEGLLNCAGFRRSIAEARAAHSSDAAKQAVLDRLEAYGEELCARSSPSPGLRPPSPASGRGDEAEICGAPPSPARGRGDDDAHRNLPPSPACGRGEGGEGGGP